jgi:hypothetical protein
MVPTYMDVSKEMSIAVLQAKPESAIAIEPQISGDEDPGFCEEGLRG